jgi:hypothetical protein
MIIKKGQLSDVLEVDPTKSVDIWNDSHWKFDSCLKSNLFCSVFERFRVQTKKMRNLNSILSAYVQATSLGHVKDETLSTYIREVDNICFLGSSQTAVGTCFDIHTRIER